MPTLGWPANGISAVRVKMRTRAWWLRVVRGQDEGGFRQVELGRDGLHLGVGQAGGVGEDGERIAAEALCR